MHRHRASAGAVEQEVENEGLCKTKKLITFLCYEKP